MSRVDVSLHYFDNIDIRRCCRQTGSLLLTVGLVKSTILVFGLFVEPQPIKHHRTPDVIAIRYAHQCVRILVSFVSSQSIKTLL